MDREKKLNVNDDGIVDLFRVFVTVLGRFVPPPWKKKKIKIAPANKARVLFQKTRFSLKRVTLLLLMVYTYSWAAVLRATAALHMVE